MVEDLILVQKRRRNLLPIDPSSISFPPLSLSRLTGGGVPYVRPTTLFVDVLNPSEFKVKSKSAIPKTLGVILVLVSFPLTFCVPERLTSETW